MSIIQSRLRPPHCHNLLHLATGMMTEVVCDRVA